MQRFCTFLSFHYIYTQFVQKLGSMEREKDWRCSRILAADQKREVGWIRLAQMVNWWLVLILVWDWCGLAIGRLGQWCGKGEELVGIKEIIPPLPFYSSPCRTILFRIKHQNFVGTVQFFKIDRQTPLLSGAGVGEAIWHGRDWQTITGRLYCQQTPTSPPPLCYSGHNADNPHNCEHNPICRALSLLPTNSLILGQSPQQQLFLLEVSTSSSNHSSLLNFPNWDLDFFLKQ